MENSKRRGSICWDKNRSQWRVRITIENRRHLIGLFTERAQAQSALVDALHDINAGQFTPPAEIRRNKRESRKAAEAQARAASLERRRQNWLKTLPRPDFDD